MIIADKPKGTPLAHLLVEELKGKNTMPFVFELSQITSTQKGVVITPEITYSDNYWPDCLLTSLAWFLMSPKLKNIICSNLSEYDNIDWIKCSVHYKEDTKDYFLLRFLDQIELSELLDISRSRFIPNNGYPNVRIFDLEKISKYSVFSPGWNSWDRTIPNYICVSTDVRKQIIKSGINGVIFKKVSTNAM